MNQSILLAGSPCDTAVGGSLLSESQSPSASLPQRLHVLLPIRGDRRERDATMLALQMAAGCRAKVTLLHVLAPPEQTSTVHWLDAIESLHRGLSGPRRTDAKSLEKTRAEMLAYVEREIPADLRKSLDIQSECRIGDVAEEIARCANDRPVDLVIVCAARSRWRWPWWSRISQRVVSLTRKPVILVHP